MTRQSNKKMKKTFFFSFIFLFVVQLNIKAQVKPTAEDTSLVKWLSFKEAFELNKKQAKPFLIDVYTGWCGWCKYMMKTTYSNPSLAGYINTYFYPVKFDAETHDTIEYLGIKYFNPGKEKRSTHQLAQKLLGQQMSFPSTIFMSNNFQFSLLSSGYLEIKKIEPLLIYTVENVFRTTPYDDFRKYYEMTNPEIPGNDTAKIEVKWYSLKEALELNKKKPKKILIDIYTAWCNSCRVMNKTTFSSPLIGSYLNKNYYLVDFNAEQKDTVVFGGQTFVNSGASGGPPFHQLAIAALKGNVILPSLILINEQSQLLDAIPYYLTPETLEPIIKYFGEDEYKTSKWPDFQSKFVESKKKKEK